MLMSAYLTRQLIKTEAPKEKKTKRISKKKKNILTTREISFYFFFYSAWFIYLYIKLFLSEKVSNYVKQIRINRV